VDERAVRGDAVPVAAVYEVRINREPHGEDLS
jgi:hypothetical protein